MLLVRRPRIRLLQVLPRFVHGALGIVVGLDSEPILVHRAVPLPGPVSDAYGCGDCFAAGFTYGLAVGKPVDEAVALGAHCGAAVLTGRGAYGQQLTAADLSGDLHAR